MSLKHFHLFFLATVLAMLAVTGSWAAGFNPAGLETPWLLKASLLGALLTTPYGVWFWRKAKELR